MFLNRWLSFLRQSAIRQAMALLAVFAVISAAAWAGTFWLAQREMTRLVDARLTAQMRAAIAAIEVGSALPEGGFGQTVALVQGGAVLSGALPDGADLELTDGLRDFDTGLQRDTDLRYLVQTVPQGQIVVTENVERQEELSDVMAGGLQVALGASLIVTLCLSLWIAYRSQTRLSRISDGLAEVARGDLSARINLPDRHDDLSLLANRIDVTTARLDQLVGQLRVQSSNIAHDLRTPLARLRALIEGRYFALLDRQEPVRPEDLEAALAQIDRIVGTFDALLRIARLESGARRAAFAPVNLKDIADIVGDTFGAVVEDAGQSLTITCDAPATVNGDKDLIVQLLANLLQNALRHGAPDQRVMMDVTGRHVCITDQGPGIPAGERRRVLEPLYQLSGARQEEGHGLGLSMVRAIADLHGATLALSEGPQGRGLIVAVHFPQFTDL